MIEDEDSCTVPGDPKKLKLGDRLSAMGPALTSIALCGHYLSVGGCWLRPPHPPASPIALLYANTTMTREKFSVPAKGSGVSALAMESFAQAGSSSIILAVGITHGTIQLYRYAEIRVGAAAPPNASEKPVAEFQLDTPAVVVTALEFAGGPAAFFAAAQDGSVRLWRHQPGLTAGSGAVVGGDGQGPAAGGGEVWIPEVLMPGQAPPPPDGHDGLPNGARGLLPVGADCGLFARRGLLC